jgi:phosphatidylglycerol---prolipoprotein diacylglyceryl transferase
MRAGSGSTPSACPSHLGTFRGPSDAGRDAHGTLAYPPAVTFGLIDVIPPSGIPIGPLDIGFYGLSYVIAVVVMLWVSGKEAARRGIDPKLVNGALVTVAICALIEARLYHVIDQWAYYSTDLAAIVLPPYSGLGLYGGIAGAIVGIAIEARRHGVPLWRALDLVVPGTLFAQAIARWGNYFNQELYGPPANLPWAIPIDCEHRVEPDYSCTLYPEATTGFHPLFLYESILNLLGGLIALTLSRRFGHRLRDGDLAAFWMLWYGGTRVALETFRSGWNWTILGIPTAMLVGAALMAIGAALIIRRHAGRRDGSSGAAAAPPMGG